MPKGQKQNLQEKCIGRCFFCFLPISLMIFMIFMVISDIIENENNTNENENNTNENENNTNENENITVTTTIQPIFSDDQVAKRLLETSKELSDMSKKYEELKSTALGLGIPSIILSVFAVWFMWIRLGQVDEMKRNVLIQQKLSNGNIQKNKNEKIEQCKKELSPNITKDNVENLEKASENENENITEQDINIITTTTAQHTLYDEQVGKQLKEMSEELSDLKEKYEELASKFDEPNDETKHKMKEECKKDGPLCVPPDNVVYMPPPSNLLTLFSAMKQASPVTPQDVETAERRGEIESDMVVVEIDG